MRFTAEIVYSAHTDAELIGPDAVVEIAQAAEAAGYDAISFNEHPIPSAKWLAAGGHDAFDPVTALAFCAAATQRIRLLPYLVVLPLHNPFLLAKSMATVDVLSGGRFVVGVCAGYLRSEFAAAGVPFEERNDRFGEALAAMLAVWSGDPVTATGHAFQALGQVATPLPTQRPHPPVWIGGNSARSRERVARAAQGWAPILNDAVGARTTRTAELSSPAAIGAAIADLRERATSFGRDPLSIEVQVQSTLGRAINEPGFSVAEQHDHIASLAEVGVTQYVVHAIADGRTPIVEKLSRFADDVGITTAP